ncbi:MAG: isoprenylcysteine carboxylmethyltransferase family protein [Dermatophilaceae bacterium]
MPFGLTWLVERAAPRSLHLGAAGRVLGWGLVVGGVALMGWAALTLRRLGTTVIPWAQVTALVAAGPYRFSRNPIYFGDIRAYLGASLVLDSAWPLVLAPFIVSATFRLVVRHEERYLLRTFGRPYADYLRRVRRWL